MKPAEVTSKMLEERMHIGSRAAEAFTQGRAAEARAVSVEPVQSAVRPADAGTLAEQSDKGRIVREVV